MEKKEVPFEYYEGKLGVKLKFLISDRNKHDDSLCLITYVAFYKRVKSKTRSERELRRASLGFPALVEYDSLGADWRDALVHHFGKPPEMVRQSFFGKFYMRDVKAFDFYLAHRYGEDETKRLTPELIEKYTINASMLNTVLEVKANRKAYAKAIGVVGQFDIWDSISRDVNAYLDVAHDLPANKDALRRKVNRYQKEGYLSLVSGKLTTRNAAVVKNTTQEAVLEELLAQGNNLNNAQVVRNYNRIGVTLNWPKLDVSTVARRRKEVELYTKSYTRGNTEFMHSKQMQAKRSRPTTPMLFWVHDGWDVELLYQKTTVNAKGHQVTTYHNRLSVVMIIDAYNDYVVGYAIGDRESPDLIRMAYKNAMQHLNALFGAYYQPHQIQSDNYQKKVLTPFYESFTHHYTPAGVGNSKAKVIEPFFSRFNANHFQEKMIFNWSGHNVTAKKANQPNGDLLTKSRHKFPDLSGVMEQVHRAIQDERAITQMEFMEQFNHIEEKYLNEMSFEKYLHVFGETTGYTNRMEGDGLEITIQGKKHWYDSFDLNWRKYMHLDWLVRYDTDDLSKVLVTNAKSRNGRLEEEIGNVTFLLEEKYLQPMALADQTQEDAIQRQRMFGFNKEQKTIVIERMIERKNTVRELAENNPQLDILQKFLIPDSLGQHKDHKSAERIEVAQKVLKRFEQADEKREAKNWQTKENEYLNQKVDLSNYLND